MDVLTHFRSIEELTKTLSLELTLLSIQECINTLKEYIGYYLQETNANRKANYQNSVRQLLKKTGFRSLKNVVDLKRNMNNAYKQEPNYIIKKKKLQNLDEKSHSIRSMIRECEKLMAYEHLYSPVNSSPNTPLVAFPPPCKA